MAMAAESPISIGAVSINGFKEFRAQSRALSGLDHALLYTDLVKAKDGAAAFQQAKKYLNAGIKVTLVVTFRSGSPNLAKIKNGAYDNRLKAFADAIALNGQPITLRIMHEANLAQNEWNGRRKGNRVGDFVPAWHRVVGLIRNRLAAQGRDKHLVRFDLNYNRRSAGKFGTSDFKMYYPGDKYVDIVSISSFNRCGLSRYHTKWHSFAEEFEPAYKAVTAMTDKPIGVAETSSTSSCGGDKAAWIHDTFRDLARRFPRVTHVTFFLSGTTVEGSYAAWQLENDRQRKAFVDGKTYLKRTRSGGDTAVALGAVASPVKAGVLAVSPSSGSSHWWQPDAYGGGLSYRLRHTFGAEPITGFGEPETEFLLSAKQCAKYYVPSNARRIDFCAGFDGNVSTNGERFWQNRLTPFAGMEHRWKISRDGSSVAVGARVLYVDYFRGDPDPPERDKDVQGEVYIRGAYSWGK